jgi:hypothetical protein
VVVRKVSLFSFIHQSYLDRVLAWDFNPRALLLFITLSPILIHLIARWRGYFYIDRQILFIMPYYLLIVAHGIHTTIRRNTLNLSNPFRPIYLKPLITSTAIFTLIALITTSYTTKRTLSTATSEGKVDWRSAATFLTNHTKPDEAIIITPGWQIRSPNYYYRGPATIIRDADVINNPATLHTTYPGVWIIFSNYGSEPQSRAALQDLVQNENFQYIASFSGLEIYYHRWQTTQPIQPVTPPKVETPSFEG